MTLTADTKVHELLKTHPFLEDFLASYNSKFEMLKNKMAGTQSIAEFWIQLRGKFIHIRYFAVRDKAGAYCGCLEVSQEVTHIRELQGEPRLLDWKATNA